ncbi:tyrosine-type recombinase/integrase [Rhodococcus wratislaviensis]|uniref:tyrosine-type recombinase/integrase n=1 Tax=Rhodococcus wratislaviensis TaxID=44752 RepID=UPI0037C8630E
MPRCAVRSGARCVPTISTRPTALCGFGRRRRRTGSTGSCPTRRRPGCCCRTISRTGRDSAGQSVSLFLLESRRNHAPPLSLWTWSTVMRRIALAADVPRFSTHTTRHLCLTDLARMVCELHMIAIFPGRRDTDSTQRYAACPGGIWPTISAAAWTTDTRTVPGDRSRAGFL